MAAIEVAAPKLPRRPPAPVRRRSGAAAMGFQSKSSPVRARARPLRLFFVLIFVEKYFS